MEYAYWKGELISASKIIEEEYIIEKRIREASNKKELLCIDPSCKNRTLKYCHGEVKKPYFSHINCLECDYARYDRMKSKEIDMVSDLIYEILKEKCFHVEKEIKLLAHHYSHLIVKDNDKITAIEFIKKGSNVKKTNELKEYDQKGIEVSWIELGSIDTIYSEKNTYYARRFLLNEYNSNLVTVDSDFNRVCQAKMDFSEYKYLNKTLLDKEMFIVKGQVGDLTYDNGIIGLEGFKEKYDIWLNKRKKKFEDKCNELNNHKSKEQSIYINKIHYEKEERQKKYFSLKQFDLLIQNEEQESNEEAKRLRKIHNQIEFEKEKPELKKKIISSNKPVRNSEGKQVYMCKYCKLIGYHNLFYKANIKGNKAVCLNCYDKVKCLKSEDI